MIAGYHTAGLSLHDVCVAIEELSHLGYGCVAIRPHAGNFGPSTPHFGQQLLRLSDTISRAHLQSVIDLDALFLHDPLVGRGPSLVGADDSQCDAAREWIEQWVGIAGEIGSQVITFSSGVADSADVASDERNLERLSMQLKQLLANASGRGVRLAIRPRFGDLIATLAQFERLGQWLGDDTDHLFLAADVGEMLSGGELPVIDRLSRNLNSLACLYLSDHRAGIAGDQRIGHGDVALTRILSSLTREGFSGPAIVRIEGHSELGLAPAREAIAIFEGL